MAASDEDHVMGAFKKLTEKYKEVASKQHDPNYFYEFLKETGQELSPWHMRVQEIKKEAEITRGIIVMTALDSDSAQGQAVDLFKIAENLFGSVSDEEDGLVTNKESAMFLKSLWATGLDWEPRSPKSSEWLRVLAAGDVDRLENLLKNVPSGEVAELLERRETSLQLSGLFHVVKGATILSDGKFDKTLNFVDHSKRPRHLQCLKKLISLGADVNAIDFLGFTPFAYCFSLYGNDVTLRLAEELLKHGAHIDAVTRVGSTALHQPAEARRLDLVKFLLDHGADPSVKNVFGETAETYYIGDIELNPMFAEVAEYVKVCRCGRCGQDNSSRCTGCFLVFYCSADCQREDWPAHKEDCCLVRSEYVPLSLHGADSIVSSVNVSSFDLKAREMAGARPPVDSAFAVKVQLPQIPGGFPSKCSSLSDTLMLMVYNKERSLFGYIDSEEPAFWPLVNKIQAEGVYGDKGFFYSLVDNKGKIKINPCRILPPETW